MTNFEQAVKLIAENYREDAAEHDFETVREVFKCYMMDNDDMLDEFSSILSESFDGEFTDDCEIIDSDGSIKTFKQLATAVKKYRF